MYSSTCMHVSVEKKLTQWVAEGGGEEDDDNDIKLGGGVQMFSVYPSSLGLTVELKTRDRWLQKDLTHMAT